MIRWLPALLLTLGACTDDTSQRVDPGPAQDATPDLPEDMAADLDRVDVSVDVVSSPPRSVCEETKDRVVCPRRTTTESVGFGGLDVRDVHWQVPSGPPPERGWPVALLFQGSLFSAELGWGGERDAPFGGFAQVRLIQLLLDAGFVVVTPEARFNGSTYWDTNIAPWNVLWETSGDHDLMLTLFEAFEAGEYGDVDLSRMYATGISSGGYMTSRMAVSYEGKFRALAIQSASYATCGGVACLVPDLPSEHPPTLFLHGSLDAIVPEFTMVPYHDGLRALGVPTRKVIDPQAGHAWLESAPEEVLRWFQEH